MSPHEHSVHEDPPKLARSITQRARWIFAAFALIAFVFLVAEHRAHLLGALPLLLLLACGILHLFMHRGHGEHGPGGGGEGK